MSDTALPQQKMPQFIVIVAFDTDQDCGPTMLFMAGQVPDMEMSPSNRQVPKG